MTLASRSLWRVMAAVSVLVLGLFVLAACGGGATPAPTAVPPTVAPTAEPTMAPPTAVPTAVPTATLAPTATAEPTAEPTVEPSPTVVVVADASNCVTCHTSEETLQQLAKEDAPAENLSEGEG